MTTVTKNWQNRIAAIILKHALLKAFGTTLFITLFFSAYFYLLRNPAYPLTVMPAIWLDRMVGFTPWALPAYASLWIYVSLPPALLSTRRELYVYGASIAATCISALLVFYFWPTSVPPSGIDWSQYPEVDFLKNMDASGNACPSLHVVTAVFSCIWLNRLLQGLGAPLWPRILNLAWCIAIVYSTLATRQHVAVDVLAGLVLGMFSAWLSLRLAPENGDATSSGI